jgi:hypothetical protein
VEHGPQSLLRAKYGIDENGIFKGVMEMVEQGSPQSFRPNMRRVSPNPE